MMSHTLTISRFRNTWDTAPKVEQIAVEALRGRLTHHRPVEMRLPAQCDPDVLKTLLDEEKCRHWSFSPVAYKPGTTRAKANVEKVFAFVADIDTGFPYTQLQERWKTPGGKPLAWVLFSTFKSRRDAPRYRVVFFFAKPVSAEDWPVVWEKLAYWLTDGQIDPNTRDASRLHFEPCCPSQWLDEAFVDAGEGELLDPDAFPDPPGLSVEKLKARRREREARGGVEDSRHGGDAEPAERVPTGKLLERALGKAATGNRNPTALWLACQLRDNGYSQAEADPVLREYARQVPDFASFDEEEALHALEQAYTKAPRQPWPQRERRSPQARRPRSREEEEADATRSVNAFNVGGERSAVVLNGRQEREVMVDAWEAVEDVNREAPRLFRTDLGLSLLVESLDGHPYTVGVTPEIMGGLLRQCADWFTERTDKKTGEVSQSPAPFQMRLPSAMARSVVEVPTSLPRLRSVVSSPVVTEDGRLLTASGFDVESGIYLSCPAVEVPDRPTQEMAKAAFARIWRLFEQFPFSEQADKANAAALLFTPALRPLLRRHNVPLTNLEAPAAGTGKTLCAHSLLSITTPGAAVVETPLERERGGQEEMSKLLGAVLPTKPAAIVFDNARGLIASGVLEMALTTGKAQCRVLGFSQLQTLDTSGVTMAMTANNAVFGADMARRAVFVRLDAGVERPEDRTGFEIADLARHIREQRGELLADLAVILAAWVEAGMLDGAAHKASFERWAAVLSGLLDFLGVEGFLANERERASVANPEDQAWREFVAAWWERFGDEPVYAKDLVTSWTDDDGKEHLGPAHEHEVIKPRDTARSLGRLLGARRDRVFGDWKICPAGLDRNKVELWMLREVRGLRGLRGLFTVLREGEKEPVDRGISENSNIEGLRSLPANPANPATRATL